MKVGYAIALIGLASVAVMVAAILVAIWTDSGVAMKIGITAAFAFAGCYVADDVRKKSGAK